VPMVDVADWPMLSGGDGITSQHSHNGLAKSHTSLGRPPSETTHLIKKAYGRVFRPIWGLLGLGIPTNVIDKSP